MTATDFDGSVVYVVGGSSGIGLAIAKQVAALGAHLTIFARRTDVLERAVAEIETARARPTQRAAYRALDVADHRQVAEIMPAVLAEHGVPSVLINCAGRAYPRRFEDISHAQFDETLRVNLGGSWNTTHAVLPAMKANGRGYIVNVASLAGLIGAFGYTDYCASKFALIGLSEALRSEVKRHGITVSVLCPPDTDTPGFVTENQTKPAETRAVLAHTTVMSADAVAQALLRGMRRRDFLIVPGIESQFAALMKRLFPSVVTWVMDRTIAQAARQR